MKKLVFKFNPNLKSTIILVVVIISFLFVCGSIGWIAGKEYANLKKSQTSIRIWER